MELNISKSLSFQRGLPMAGYPEPLLRTSSQEAEIDMGYDDPHPNPNPKRRVSTNSGKAETLAIPTRESGSQMAELWGGFRPDFDSAMVSLVDQNWSSSEGRVCKKRKTLSEEDVEMDREIWGDIPHEMVDIVVEHLPFTALVRARAVCKRWNSRISNPGFESCHGRDSPWLMLQCKDGGPVRWFFDLGLNKWHKIEAKAFERTVCVAASGGILCLYKESVRSSKLSLFNPISMDRIKLPVLNGRVKLAALAMDPGSESYRLLVVVLGRNGLMMRMHQPNSSRWTKLDTHTSSKLLKGVTDAVLCQDRLYCITHKNWGILKVYDVGESVWKDLAVKRPRIFSVNLKKTPRLYLVESQGELLMVLWIMGPWWDGPEDDESSTEGVQELVDVRPLERKRVWIFRFDPAQTSWIELVDIQGRILFLSRLGSKSVQATGRGNLICFVETEGSNHVLSYDVGTECWEEFAAFPEFSEPLPANYLHYPTEGLWLEPRMR